MQLSKNRIFGVLGTLIVHIFLVLFLFLHIQPNKGNPVGKPGEVEKGRVLSLKVVLLPKMTSEQEEAEKQRVGERQAELAIRERICSNKDPNYVGVGLIHGFGSDVVSEAPEFYPAYKAGVRVGDLILNPEFNSKATKEGWVEVRVERQGKFLIFKIKQEKICFESNYGLGDD